VQSLCSLLHNNFLVFNTNNNCWKSSYNLWTSPNHNSRSLEGLGFRACYSQARRQDFAAGGPKTTRGVHSFKYNIGCMQQPVGQHKMGEHKFQKRGRAPLAPPLATALATARLLNLLPLRFETQTFWWNYSKVFSLRWRINHFALNLLSWVCLNII